MASNEVRIDITADTTKAKQGFKDVRGETDKLKKTGQGLSSVFGGVNKAMGIAGLGTLSLGFVLREAVSTGQDFVHTMATARFSILGLGDAGREAFDRIKEAFPKMRKELGATESQLSTALAAIMRITGRTDVEIRLLEGAFHLAHLTGNDLATTAIAIGHAINGDIKPINALLGVTDETAIAFSNLDTILKQAAIDFRKAKTPVDDIKDSIGRFKEDVGKATTNTSDLLDLLSQIGSTIVDLPSMPTALLLAPIEKPIKQAVDSLDFQDVLDSLFIHMAPAIGRAITKVPTDSLVSIMDEIWSAIASKTVSIIKTDSLVNIMDDIWSAIESKTVSIIKKVTPTAKAIVSPIIAIPETAIDFVAELADAVADAIGDTIGAINNNLENTIGRVLEDLGFQSGGVSAGGLAVVGERGPELLNLPSGTHIRPSLAGAGMGGGGGMTIVIQGDVIMDDEIRMEQWTARILEGIRTSLRREGATL